MSGALKTPIVARRTMLERLVDERVGQSLVSSVSVAVDRIAEEIAREALVDDTVRAGRTDMAPWQALPRSRTQDQLSRRLPRCETRAKPVPGRRRAFIADPFSA
jgi:hypothetical protein